MKVPVSVTFCVWEPVEVRISVELLRDLQDIYQEQYLLRIAIRNVYAVTLNK
jgi:hypothetical protein